MVATDALRVLVVNDHVDLAETLGRLVDAWGFDVRVAFSGAEGMMVVEEGFRPDVVVNDVGEEPGRVTLVASKRDVEFDGGYGEMLDQLEALLFRAAGRRRAEELAAAKPK